jgi:hypothetical protein
MADARQKASSRRVIRDFIYTTFRTGSFILVYRHEPVLNQKLHG